MSWFILFNPNADPKVPANYIFSAGTPTCTNGNRVCAIEATNDGTGHPIITSALSSEIDAALASGQATTHVKLQLVLGL